MFCTCFKQWLLLTPHCCTALFKTRAEHIIFPEWVLDITNNSILNIKTCMPFLTYMLNTICNTPVYHPFSIFHDLTTTRCLLNHGGIKYNMQTQTLQQKPFTSIWWGETSGRPLAKKGVTNSHRKWSVVVCKLCQGEEVDPVILLIVYVHLKILFQIWLTHSVWPLVSGLVGSWEVGLMPSNWQSDCKIKR